MTLCEIGHRIARSEDKSQPFKPTLLQKFFGKTIGTCQSSLETPESGIRISHFFERIEKTISMNITDRLQDTAGIPEGSIQRGYRTGDQSLPIRSAVFALLW